MTKSGALGILWGCVGEMEGDRATGRGQGKGATERCRLKALERGMKHKASSPGRRGCGSAQAPVRVEREVGRPSDVWPSADGHDPMKGHFHL